MDRLPVAAVSWEKLTKEQCLDIAAYLRDYVEPRFWGRPWRGRETMAVLKGESVAFFREIDESRTLEAVFWWGCVRCGHEQCRCSRWLAPQYELLLEVFEKDA